MYQDLALCDNLDIVQNMFLGMEETKYGLLDEIRMELATVQTLKDLAVSTVKSVRQRVESLSGGQRQAVAVARAVMRESKLVILDEPTAALGVTQTAQVLALIKTLASRGISVLVISHNLSDVFAVADRIAVMYLGSIVERSDFDVRHHERRGVDYHGIDHGREIVSLFERFLVCSPLVQSFLVPRSLVKTTHRTM